jgi:hypothetical protein
MGPFLHVGSLAFQCHLTHWNAPVAHILTPCWRYRFFGPNMPLKTGPSMCRQLGMPMSLTPLERTGSSHFDAAGVTDSLGLKFPLK